MGIDRSRIRPSLAWLGLAGAVAVAGVAGAVVLFVLLIQDVTGSFSPLDGSTVVRLEEGEGRGIWAYTEVGVSGSCSAVGPARAEMKPTNGVSVTSGGREYHSFLRFQAPRAGAYRVRCAASQPLALGPHVTGLRLVAGIGGVLASFFGGLLAAAAIVAAVLILRERSQRRLELAAREPG